MTNVELLSASSSTPRPSIMEVALLPEPPVERSAYNRKDRHPSAAMLPPDGNRYKCPWLDDSITVHSDGNISCGLDDPHARRSFGNVTHQSVAAVFANPEFRVLQDKLWEGYRCSDCSLYQLQPADAEPPAMRSALPSVAIIETTVKCNLRCPNAACDPNNDNALKTRDRNELSLGNFQHVIDQLGNHLRQVYFFNYGEPFFNRDAIDMLVYLRQACPAAKVITSTNAIPLALRGKAEKIVPCLDQVTVTLSGISQASYARYHINGQVGQALLGLQSLCEAKRTLGLATPQVVWRYLLFRWNDSEAEIKAAVALAGLYGVDVFQLYLTHIPENSSSYRFAPGTQLFAKYRRHIDTVFGYQSGTVPINGLYGIETVPELGRAQWTGWRARLCRKRHGHWLRLAVATMRPDRGAGPGYCLVRTPWGTHKILLQFAAWQSFSFLIPWALRDEEAFDMTLVTPGAWFPIDEIDTADMRCLGVLVRDDKEDDDLAATDEDRYFNLRHLVPPTPEDIKLLDELPLEMGAPAQHTNAGRLDL